MYFPSDLHLDKHSWFQKKSEPQNILSWKGAHKDHQIQLLSK